MTRCLAVALWLTGLPIFALAVLGQDGQEKRVGEIVLVDPEKKVLGRRSAGKALELRPTSDVYTEMEIETLEGAFAEVDFDQGGYLELDPETRVLITESSRSAHSDDCEIRRGSGPRPEVSMTQGQLLVAVVPRGSWTFDVVAGPADVLICGSLVAVRVDRDVAVVSVFEGLAEVWSEDAYVLVEGGLRTVVRRGSPPTPPAPFDPSEWTLSPAAGDEFFDGDGNLPGEIEVLDRTGVR